MIRKVFALLFALALLFPASARADHASKRAKIGELLTLSNAEQMLGQVVDQMSAAMKASAAQQAARYNFSPEQQQIADAFLAKVTKILAQSLSMENIRPVVIQTYDETYTEDEIDGILAFYRSPAGKAFLAKTPQLMQRTMTLMQQQMATVQPQVEQATKEMAEEMTKTKGK